MRPPHTTAQTSHLRDGRLRCPRVAVRLMPQPHVQLGIEGVVALLVGARSLRSRGETCKLN